MVLTQDLEKEIHAYHINETFHEMIKTAERIGYRMVAAAANAAGANA